jgi:hypothetical protein
MFDVILLMRNPFLAHLAKGSELLRSFGHAVSEEKI